MISVQQSENSQNQKPVSHRSSDMTTDMTQTLSLNLICESNETYKDKIENLQKQLSSEIPCIEIIKEYSCLFTIQLQPIYLISYQNLKQLRHTNEEQLGIGGNGSVYLCTDLGTLELHAVKLITNISFDNIEPILYECINQYHLMQCSKEMILNMVNLIQIRVINSYVDFQIPLELAEFSLYDYIQDNEINEKIYQQLINTLIDFLILLHSNNYAHRDIKPQNILYVKDVGWKLADFGECVNYDISKGLHKIKGTLAFLPQEVRKHCKQNREILQDLFRNDIYATVCTLVMIKNPQFRSQDLQIFMQEENFDEICTKLINITKFEELYQLKLENVQKFIYVGKITSRHDELVSYDVKIIVKFYFQLNKILDDRIIQIIDKELGKLRINNEMVEYNKILLQLIQYFPFQIDQFNNIDDKFDHGIILKNPELYFSNIIEQCQYYFQMGLHSEITEFSYKIQKLDSFDAVFIILYTNILYGYIDEAKDQLKLLASKLYTETSQVSSDFLGFYNHIYYILYGEFPIINREQTYDTPQIQLTKRLKSFQKKDLKDQDIQEYLSFESFKTGNTLNLEALFHPLQSKFVSFRNEQIFDHILHNLGCNREQIKEHPSLLSILLKQHLQINNSHTRDLQLIIYGCMILYQQYDLLLQLIDLLAYFQKILTISKPGLHNLELLVEQQRLMIKYNIFVDYKIQDSYNYLKQTNSSAQNDFIIIVLLSNICNFQQKIIKQQFKRKTGNINKTKLNLTVDLLTSLQLAKYQRTNQKKLIDLQHFLYNCILQSKPKYQQRFLQGTIIMHQQSINQDMFITHLNNMKQYKRIINNYTFNSNLDVLSNKHKNPIANSLLKYHTLNNLLKYYPSSKISVISECYGTKQKNFQTYTQHLNTFAMFPRMRKMHPLHNQDLKHMFLSKS